MSQQHFTLCKLNRNIFIIITIIYLSVLLFACEATVEDVKKTTNQKVLIDIAKNAENTDVRMAAVKKITDQKALIDIANNVDNDWVQMVAAQKITNQNSILETLFDMAKNSNYEWIKYAAVEKLTDQKSLIDIAKNDAIDYSIRTAALDKITDQNTIIEILTDVAKNAAKDWMRWDAITQITDQKSLIGIAHITDDSQVKWDAVRRITDQNAIQEPLIDIAKNPYYDFRVRITAVGKINNLEPLIDIAKDDYDSNVSRAVVKIITDQKALIYIAKNAEDDDVRMIALRKITNQNGLIDIIKNAEDYKVRMVAFRNLGRIIMSSTDSRKEGQFCNNNRSIVGAIRALLTEKEIKNYYGRLSIKIDGYFEHRMYKYDWSKPFAIYRQHITLTIKNKENKVVFNYNTVGDPFPDTKDHTLALCAKLDWNKIFSDIIKPIDKKGKERLEAQIYSSVKLDD